MARSFVEGTNTSGAHMIVTDNQIHEHPFVSPHSSPKSKGYPLSPNSVDAVSNSGASSVTSSSCQSNDCSYVASTLVDSGVYHHSIGQHDKAVKAFRTALKTQELMLGRNHICVAHTLGNLGSVLLTLGRLDEATEVLLDSLNLKTSLRMQQKDQTSDSFSQAFPPELTDHVVLSDTLINLGNVSYLQGNDDESLNYYLRALKELNSLGLNARQERDLAHTLHNIGRVHTRRNELNDAMVAFSESLWITKETRGSECLEAADTLEKIGSIHLAQGQIDEAMTAFVEVLDVTRNVLGPDHPDLAPSYHNIGRVHQRKGDLKEAWEAYSAALDIYKRCNFSMDHIGMKTARRSIANVEKLIVSRRS